MELSGSVMRKIGLSSAWTFSAKFVFPALWISGFGLGTVSLWLDAFHGRNNELPPSVEKFVFLGVWIVGSVFILWVCAGLKRVRADGRQLFVSNYRREICIPLNAVQDVRQNRWLNIRPVTIYFRVATEFGDRAKFMPKRRIAIRFWRVDPIVNELKQLAGLLPDA
ncbi:hypothetical protein ACQR1W_06335 [Bradyrhizobium sp. HKCCYLS1011]|uniref:hypothetical protein n=1 Tax=Bradyrhizobium sp. HKCCYLS1011 TaxID=3420733 RepID=UPI003EC14E4E